MSTQTNLASRMGALAGELDRLGFEIEEGEDCPAIGRLFHVHAIALSQLIRELEETYVPRDEAGEIPTNAQGQALARFLRPAFRGDARDAFATVARGGFDLPDGYIYVRLADGYEGGIARNGDTST